MNAARQRTAAGKVASDVVARLHHLDDAGLCALARAVAAEVRERETTAARMVTAGATMTDDERADG
jgi:hypothetical protein